MSALRKWIAILTGVVVLAAVNVGIWQREQLVAQGQVVLLELAPVDPRSLMQGDYMALRFALEGEVRPVARDGQGWQDKVPDGQVVVRLDEQGVGRFVRLADGGPLAAGEVLLRYRFRNNRVQFATNAFFFQEGQANAYDGARYGEFRVAPDGEMILTALRGPDYEVLGPQP